MVLMVNTLWPAQLVAIVQLLQAASPLQLLALRVMHQSISCKVIAAEHAPLCPQSLLKSRFLLAELTAEPDIDQLSSNYDDTFVSTLLDHVDRNLGNVEAIENVHLAIRMIELIVGATLRNNHRVRLDSIRNTCRQNLDSAAVVIPPLSNSNVSIEKILFGQVDPPALFPWSHILDTLDTLLAQQIA
jgi:hypothetical protein